MCKTWTQELLWGKRFPPLPPYLVITMCTYHIQTRCRRKVWVCLHRSCLLLSSGGSWARRSTDGLTGCFCWSPVDITWSNQIPVIRRPDVAAQGGYVVTPGRLFVSQQIFSVDLDKGAEPGFFCIGLLNKKNIFIFFIFPIFRRLTSMTESK